MTARAASTRTSSLRRTASLRRLTDPRPVRRYLEAAGAYSAYALAYLDRRHFPLAEFYEASSGERRALVMHARGGLGPSTFTLGDVSLVGAVLQLHPGPQQAFLTCQTDQVDAVLVTHNLWRPQTMLRMQLDRHAFSPPTSSHPVRRLLDADAAELNRLYSVEDDGLRYSGRQVREGVYFGIHHRDRLVAAAGTHIYSARQGVGVVGNVFTHPDFRGHGMGTAVTAAVTKHLIASCGLIVLNVDPANRTARHIYEQLGYTDTVRLVEAMATRRDGVSAMPFVRRVIARWRSPAPDAELVEL